MKRFTIIFSILLVIGFTGTMVGIGMSPDFSMPTEPTQAADPGDERPPVWDKNMDDLLAYLEEKGILTMDSVEDIGDDVATEARAFNYAGIFWWDVENLEEGSVQAIAYQEMCEDGAINRGNGVYLILTRNGPFGLNPKYYKGDVAALVDAFLAFGQEETQTDTGATNPDSQPAE